MLKAIMLEGVLSGFIVNSKKAINFMMAFLGLSVKFS